MIYCEHCRRDFPPSHYREKRHPYRRLRGGETAGSGTISFYCSSMTGPEIKQQPDFLQGAGMNAGDD